MRRNAGTCCRRPARALDAPQGSHLRGNNDWGGLTRRAALLGLASAFTLGRASLALADAPTDRRFVVVNLRGALDGLSAVVPYGDAALTDLRGELVPPAPGEDGGMLDLGGDKKCRAYRIIASGTPEKSAAASARRAASPHHAWP